MARLTFSTLGASLVALALGYALGLPAAPLEAQQGEGRIAGQVLNTQTGRPVSNAEVQVLPVGLGLLTSADGRFRTAPLPTGIYSVVVQSLGYSTVQVDSVAVVAGETTTLNLTLTTQAIELAGIEVVSERSGRTASAAGLLAAQRAAPVVSDGISAEQISRSPDSDAGDAIARVTGVSVVDNKFVVVRGLSERYSNTLLNGTELSSPEPAKRVVPLDIFPASLLESLVTTKAATPDRPGDFAGGSLDIKTKEFPDEEIFQVSTSFGGNSNGTFESLPFIPREGEDFLGFDGQSRSVQEVEATEAFAESLRGVWTPPSTTVLPDFGIELQYGNQWGEFEEALGLVLSFDYGLSNNYRPDDYFAFVGSAGAGRPSVEAQADISTRGARWGVVANLSRRLGANHSISLKNMLTRENEESLGVGLAFDPEVQTGFQGTIQNYQVRYVDRTFLQSQLAGRDLFQDLFGLLDMTLEWKGTLSLARRDEPENRSLNYLQRDDGRYQVSSSAVNPFWFRFLDETTYAGQADLIFPFSTWDRDDALFKTGVLYRDRDRDFDASLYNLRPPFTGIPDEGALLLPPEQLFTPENIGRNVDWVNISTGSLPYEVDETILSFYAMVDIPLLPGLRAVGGLRREQWDMDVYPNSREEPFGETVIRSEADNLLSLNLTYGLTDSQNLRAAVYQTVSRPDPREVTNSRYVEITGRCETTGNPDLNRARIFNADLRWEWFPAAGELVSSSVFYKSFDDPITQSVSLESLSCVFRPFNATSAVNFGAEIEVRKNLGFITDGLERFTAAANFTFTEGDVDPPDEIFGSLPNLPLQDQSRYLANGSLDYDDVDREFSASILFNWVGERTRRYGVFSNVSGEDGTQRAPDVRELPRGTLDAKIRKGFGDFSVSLSGRNLTNQNIREVQSTDLLGELPVGLTVPGVSISMSVSYAF